MSLSNEQNHHETITKEKLDLLKQFKEQNIPEEILNMKTQEEEVKICSHCGNPDIMEMYPLLDWNIALKLYYSLIEPLENFVKEHANNRQTANQFIDKCKHFPNKSFNIDDYDAKLNSGRAEVTTGFHNSIFIFDIEHTQTKVKDLVLMSYSCKFPTKRVYTYNGYIMSYAKTLNDAKPNNWENIPGSSDVKEEEFDNWLFYSKRDGIFDPEDRTTYQIIGWSEDKFALYFTTEMVLDIKSKKSN